MKNLNKIMMNNLLRKMYILFTYICAPIPDSLYLKMIYRIRMGKKLNLDNPSTFNEKLQWLKIHDIKPEYTIMVDKYAAKNYVAELIGEEYIIPTIGIWKNFDEIDFAELPQSFVLKCTHDSGGMVICRDKTEFEYESARKKLKAALKRDYWLAGREHSYKGVPHRIIAEQYLESDNELRDYKFYCFNGKPEYLYISEGLTNHSTARISFFDLNFNIAPFQRADYEGFDYIPSKPRNFGKMVEIAKILSKDMRFLRVDLYNIEGKIYFSELTQNPAGGYMPFVPEDYDAILGEKIEL